MTYINNKISTTLVGLVLIVSILSSVLMLYYTMRVDSMEKKIEKKNSLIDKREDKINTLNNKLRKKKAYLKDSRINQKSFLEVTRELKATESSLETVAEKYKHSVKENQRLKEKISGLKNRSKQELIKPEKDLIKKIDTVSSCTIE